MILIEEIPLHLLEGFSGCLQTDGYAAYGAVCKQEGITQVGCWDHVRRKFQDAQKTVVQAMLNISNAAAENAIRPLTVGRRNWLFADTPA